MKIVKSVLSVASALICFSAHSQNLILNGSFENNTAIANTLNLTSTWSSVVSDCFEVDGGSMDLITSNNCGMASDGAWYVTCSPQSGLWPYLAFSFKLSVALTAGSSYTLSFDKRYCGPNTSPIDIGISDDSTLMGTIFHTFAAPLVNSWATETYIFQAVSDAKYLTVNIGASGSTGTVGLDNFILQPGSVGVNEYVSEHPGIFTDPSSGTLFISFPAPVSKKEIKIYNAIGAIVYQSVILPVQPGQKSGIDISSLPGGIYIVKVYYSENSYAKKITVQ